MTTTHPPSLPVLKDLAEEAGLDAKVFQLLVDHGITNSGTFFYTFQDPVAVKKLLTPATVGEGVKLTSGTAVKLDDVQFMVALSVMAHMVDEIRVAKAKRDGVLQSASTTSTAAAAVATSGAKAPKVLPEGYWAEFRAEFQSEKIGGIARQFPTHLLSGADEVLARLVHERVTRSHTPLKLGEIVAHRQFTASGQINPFRIKEEPGSRMLLRDDGMFDRAPRHVPEPQKLQTFLDFLDSVKYGLLFARWGPELSIDAWIGWFSNLVRDHPQKFPQLRELYLRSSWTLCMELRQGVPFATAYKTVVSQANVAEALARYLPPDSKGKGGKGEVKGRFKTHQSEVDSDPRKRPGPYRPGTGKATGSQATGQGQQQGAPQCRLFAAGHCKFGSSCKFAHGAQQPPHHAPHKRPRDSSERPHRQGRHPFFLVGGQLNQPLRLVP